MLTPRQKRALKRIIGQQNYWKVDPLAERQYVKDCFDKYSEHGRIAICRKGHDCDHYHYNTVRVIDTPKGVFAFCRYEEEHRQWLDGPEAMWIDPPSKHGGIDHYEGRDVAAERAGY